MHNTLVKCFLGLLFVAPFFSGLAQAESSYIYSYERYGADEGAWALLPVLLDLPDHQATSLFDALKRRKRPTYGATDYKASGHSVIIDGEKCAYATMITAEISETFVAHGQKLPSFQCGGNTLSASTEVLPIFSPILPLWQAFSSAYVPKAAHVRMGTTLVPYTDFKQSLDKWDVALMRQIEALLDDPNPVVQASVMSTLLAKKPAGAQELVADRLTSQAPQTRYAAFFALRKTVDPKIISRLIKALDQSPSDAERFARSAVESLDVTLRQKGIRILLASGKADAFVLALAAIQKNDDSDVVTNHFESILRGITPEQASQLTQYLISVKAVQTASDWLDAQSYSPKAEAVAKTIIEQHKVTHEGKAKTDAMLLPAFAMMLESPNAEAANEALAMLILKAKTDQSPSLSKAFLRGILSPHQSLRDHAMTYLMQASSPAPTRLGNLLVALSKADAEQAELCFILSRGLRQSREALKSATTDLERCAAILAHSNTDDAWLLAAAKSPQTKGAVLISKARLTPDAPGLIEELGQMALSTDLGLRRDAAFALRFLGTQADKLRLLLLKDSDASVARVAMRSLDDTRHAHLARDIIGIVKSSDPMTRITALGVLPSLLNEQSSAAISTFAANEVFDEDLGVKAAAQASLARIARESKETITAENAVASIALTLQDSNPKIRRLTLIALAQSQRPSAKPLIEAGLKADPSFAQAVELREKVFPFPAL